MLLRPFYIDFSIQAIKCYTIAVYDLKRRGSVLKLARIGDLSGVFCSILL